MRTDGELVAEVLRRHDDAAGRQFDEALARSGLSTERQRELRFWHHQSLAGLREYAAETVPAVLATVGEARRESAERVCRAQTLWDSVARAHAPAPDATAPPNGAPTTSLPAAPEVGDALEARRRTVASRLASGS